MQIGWEVLNIIRLLLIISLFGIEYSDIEHVLYWTISLFKSLLILL